MSTDASTARSPDAVVPDAAAGPWAFAGDLVALTKPRLSALVVLTAGGGVWLAPGPLPLATAFWAILGTTLLVGAANALNCWLERDVDARMTRTATRPLPAGRIDPAWGIVVGGVLSLVSLPILWVGTNPLTAALGATALVFYVAFYTPLKRRSPLAVYVGTVPGAMPTLMGWTAVTGGVGAPGLALFGILALWQVPHFLAIGTFGARQYERAGFRIGPLVWGRRSCWWQAVIWAAVLVPVSVLPTWLGAAGPVYAVVALAASIAYLVAAARPMGEPGDDATTQAWAKRLFFTSLAYVPVVFFALALDGGW